MQSKTLQWIIIVLLVVIIAIGAIFLLSNNKGTTTTKTSTPLPVAVATVTPTAISTIALSEQPDKVKFAGYFSEAYLGKLAIGVQVGPPDGMPARTTVFTAAADQFCLNLNLKKAISASTIAGAVYDVSSKSDIETKSAFPRELQQGGNSSCEPISLPAGQYEKKIYIDDVLVAVLPFTIK